MHFRGRAGNGQQRRRAARLRPLWAYGARSGKEAAAVAGESDARDCMHKVAFYSLVWFACSRIVLGGNLICIDVK